MHWLTDKYDSAKLYLATLGDSRPFLSQMAHSGWSISITLILSLLGVPLWVTGLLITFYVAWKEELGIWKAFDRYNEKGDTQSDDRLDSWVWIGCYGAASIIVMYAHSMGRLR